MDFSAFLSQWIGGRVADPSLGSKGIPQDKWYENVSLVKDYIRRCVGVEPNQGETAELYWTNTTDLLLSRFQKFVTNDVMESDIVIMLRASGYHIGLGTGRQNTIQFEIVEQDGENPDGTGLNDNAVRYRWVRKAKIVGVLRPINKLKHYEYSFPSAALKVPLRTQKYFVRGSVPRFSAPRDASQHKNAKGVLTTGNYYVFKRLDGMVNISKIQNEPGFWVNPADNKEYATISI